MYGKPDKPYASQGQLLRAIRYNHSRGQSQTALAGDFSSLGSYSKSDVSKWETGERKPPHGVLERYEQLANASKTGPKLAPGELARRYGEMQNAPKPHTESVTANLGWLDVEHAIRTLIYRLRSERFDPEIIVGVDRGGPIVAGLLAKAMVKPVSHITCGKWRITSSPEESLARGLKDMLTRPQNIAYRGKALVVDDACRTGGTLTTAMECLTANLDGVDLKCAVLLNAMPELRTAFHPDLWVYTSHVENIGFPWDTDSFLTTPTN